LNGFTVTVCTPVDVFPHVSAAVHVTFVVPVGYAASSGCPSLRTADTAGNRSHVSVAVAVPIATTAVHNPASAFVTIPDGTLNTGGTLSAVIAHEFSKSGTMLAPFTSVSRDGNTPGLTMIKPGELQKSPSTLNVSRAIVVSATVPVPVGTPTAYVISPATSFTFE
jgi:hypothetical protein